MKYYLKHIESINRFTIACYSNDDEFAFCNCNRNLEYLIARYRKLKGGE